MDASTTADRLSARRPSDGGRPPSAVVFDLGGVLIDWDPRHLYRSMFAGDEAAMEAFLATVCTPEWNARQDAGRPWAEAVVTLVEEFPAERERILAFHERWPEMLGGPIEGTVAILGELHNRRVPVYALSNWSAETFPSPGPATPSWAGSMASSSPARSVWPSRTHVSSGSSSSAIAWARGPRRMSTTAR